MSPSRGISRLLLQPRLSSRLSCVRRYSDFVRAAINPSNKAQIYVSRTLDPYLNLSIEHYLLQKSPPDSTILFLYTNRPSIILGRNQNPWVEVNLGYQRNNGLGVQLVRRRSGGGTVFHDEGNVNYSVICPTPTFNRDKHAEMVVRALQKLGIEKARVNERHDIVLDKLVDGEQKAFKISGSAYKLTRLRSLHHGTCLLSSPNLPTISNFLRSPAKSLIKARGVESVSSSITNVGLSNVPFEEAVVEEFRSMHGGNEPITVTEKLKDVPEISKGLEELESEDWIFCQTPQFTFSIDSNSNALGNSHPSSLTANFTVRNGRIIDASVRNVNQEWNGTSGLLDLKFHEIKDWEAALQKGSWHPSQDQKVIKGLGARMNQLLGGCHHSSLGLR